MLHAVVHHLALGSTDAKRLAARLGLDAHEIQTHHFPDGELRIRVGPAAPVTLLYVPLYQPNEKLLALLFSAEALRREGARRLVLVAPYMCYMRQDAAFRPGEAISQRAIGVLLAQTFDRIVTIDAHLHRTTDIRKVFEGVPAENLSATPAIAAALRATNIDPATLIIGPDEESETNTRMLAKLTRLDYVVARKIRRGDRDTEITLPNASVIAARPVVIFDDVASSGGTLIACAHALADAGARRIDAVITHALFDAPAARALTEAGIRSVRSANTVPHPTNAFIIDDILVSALQNEISPGSVA